MNAIEIKGLRKTYPGFVLDDIDLVLPSGCIMGLIGENGAGKSTLFRLLLQMARRDGGSVSLLGQDTGSFGSKESERVMLSLKEDIGVVFDNVGIPAEFNAAETGEVMKRTYRNWDSAAYNEFLEKMSVPTGKKFKEFSRGMQMKLGIAIALSHGAKLLLLDEATAGLDPVIRDEILDVFSEFTRDEGNSILISSHIVSDLEKICDYIAFLHEGRLLLCEEKDVLRENYGIIRCTNEQADRLDQNAVIGRRDGAYGTEVIIKKDSMPRGIGVGPVDVEQLFIFMARGNK